MKFKGLFADRKAEIYEKLRKKSEFRLFCDWASNIFIRTKDRGLVKFSPDTWFYTQWLAVEALFSDEKTIIILKPRQAGVTTVCVIFDIFNAFTKQALKGSILSGDYKLIKEIRNIIKDAVQLIPKEYRIPLVKNNDFIVSFKNGNSFNFYYPTLKKKSEGTMGRGGASNYAHLTEVAYFANTEDLNAFVSGFSDSYPNRKYIYESTANGINHFYDMWKLNKDAPGVKTLFFGWWAHDNYVSYDRHDHEFYDEPVFEWETEKVQEVKEMYGYEITKEQLIWYRKTAREKHNLNEDIMMRDFPFTEEDAFQTSGKKAFKREVIEAVMENVTSPVKRYSFYISADLKEAEVSPAAFGKLIVWEDFDDVDRKIAYVIGVDPSLSINPDSDNSCIQVLKCFSNRIEQVAEMASNDVDEYNLAFLIAFLACKYGGTINIELQGGGQGTFYIFDNLVKMLRYQIYPPGTILKEIKDTIFKEFLYYRRDSLRPSFAKHTYMTHQIKLRVFKLMESELRTKRLIIRSRSLAEELNNMIREGDVYSPVEGHDDRVMALGLALLAYQDLNPSNLVSYDEYLKKKENFHEEERPIDRFKEHLFRSIVGGGRLV